MRVRFRFSPYILPQRWVLFALEAEIATTLSVLQQNRDFEA